MASGVEVAGLVLGTLPLILAGLQFYAEGITVMRRLRMFRSEVNELIVEIMAENAKYRNSIELLLIGVVSSRDMAEFLANPGGDLWKERNFDQKLRGRLGGSYDAYMSTIAHLHIAVKKLEDRLKLTAGTKPQFLPQDTNKFKEHYKRLKFSLKKSDYDDLMASIRHANSSIRNLTSQALNIEARRTCDRSPIPNFKAIKQRAECFYSALSTSWSCQCRTQHSVSLLLEPRIEDVASDSDDEESINDQFHVLFRYSHHHPMGAGNLSTAQPWTWDEADVRVVLEPIDVTTATVTMCNTHTVKSVRFTDQAAQAVQAALKPKANLQPIKDLCSAIHALQCPQRDACFSLLKNEFIRQRYGFLVYPTETLPSDTDFWSVSSLRTAFTAGMTRRDRLKLAVTLASSVLQLHETPWLDDDWGIDNIFFIERPGVNVYDYPFVARQFDQVLLASTSAIPSSMSHVIPNQTLYGLGLTLIELWYGKTLAELHEAGDGFRDSYGSLTEFLTVNNTAFRLMRDLEEDAGETYSDAVRRCIQCDFKSRARSFQDAQFQKAVFEGVVVQLQANYEYLHKGWASNC